MGPFDKLNPFNKIAKALVPEDDNKALRAALKDKPELTDEEMDEKIIRSRRRGDIELKK